MIVILVVTFILGGLIYFSGDAERIALSSSCPGFEINVVPSPKYVDYLDCNNFVGVDSTWQIFVDIENSDDSFVADYIRNEVIANSSGSIDFNILSLDQITSDKRIIVGNPNEDPFISQLANAKGIDINSDVLGEHGQGYVLYIDQDEIFILGEDYPGLFYSAVTLTWLLTSEQDVMNLAQVSIHDWPDINIRGFYGDSCTSCASNHAPPFYTDKYEWIDNLAKYKYNLWTAGIGTIYNTSSIESRLADKQYILERGFLNAMSIYPSTVDRANPNLFEGLYSYDAPFVFDGQDVLVPRDEITSPVEIVNPGFEESSGGADQPVGWYFGLQNFSEGDYWSIDCGTGNAHSGNCAAKLTQENDRTDYGRSGAHMYSENYSRSYLIEENKYYLFSLWLKKIQIDNDKKPQVTVGIVDENGDATGSSRSTVSLNGSNSWKKQQIMIIAYPDTTHIGIYSKAQPTTPLEFWIDDIEIIEPRFLLRNVIDTPDGEPELWNVDRTIKYQRGVDYTITHSGVFNVYDYVNGRETTIERIPTGSIDSGQEIRLDHNYVITFQDTRTPYNTLLDPLAYETFDSYTLKPAMEAIDPDYVFIGMDEIRGMNRDGRAIKRGLENYQVLAMFLNNVTRMIHEYNPDTTVLMWDDMISPFHNGQFETEMVRYGGKEGATWHSVELLDRSIVPIAWWYGNRDLWHKVSDSMKLYNELGFESIGGPWDNEMNVMWWSQMTNEYDGIGMLSHEFYNRIGQISNTSEHSWNLLDMPIGQNSYNLEVCDNVDNDGDDLYLTGNYINTTWPDGYVDEGFNLSSDIFNCGECGNICYYPRGFSSCVDGACRFDSCYHGYEDRNGDLSDGCEYPDVVTFTGGDSPTGSGGGYGGLPGASSNRGNDTTSFDPQNPNIETPADVFYTAVYFVQSHTPGVMVFIAIIITVLVGANRIYFKKKKKIKA